MSRDDMRARRQAARGRERQQATGRLSRVMLRMDRSGISRKLARDLAGIGIVVVHDAPHHPASKGVAERTMCELAARLQQVLEARETRGDPDCAARLDEVQRAATKVAIEWNTHGLLVRGLSAHRRRILSSWLVLLGDEEDERQ